MAYKITDNTTQATYEMDGDYGTFIETIRNIVNQHNLEESKYQDKRYFQVEIDGDVATIDYLQTK